MSFMRLKRAEFLAEAADSMLILDLYPMTRIHVKDEYDCGDDPEDGEYNPWDACFEEPEFVREEYWPGQLYIVTMMELKSQFIVKASPGYSAFDVDEFPAAAAETAAEMLGSLDRRPEALLVPDRWEDVARTFYTVFHYPLYDWLFCCDENLPFFSGMHQWRRCLEAWEMKYSPYWPYDHSAVYDDLHKLVALRNGQKLTPLEQASPAENSRWMKKLKR